MVWKGSCTLTPLTLLGVKHFFFMISLNSLSLSLFPYTKKGVAAFSVVVICSAEASSGAFSTAEKWTCWSRTKGGHNNDGKAGSPLL